jgi:outer membrane protein assembly factor BamB
LPVASCEEAILEGAAASCDATCSLVRITRCASGDGCCGEGCSPVTDTDCRPSGTVIWRAPIEGDDPATPAVGLDGGIYVSVKTPGIVVALEPADGAVRWTYETGWWFLSAPAIADDGAVLVASGDIGTVAIDPDTGLERWRFNPGSGAGATPALGQDGEIYTLHFDDVLYALDAAGEELWRVDLGPRGTGDNAAVAVLHDGSVIAAARSGRVARVRDGEVLWSFTSTSPFQTNPAVGDDGVIYLAGNDFDLYAVQENGALAWRLPLGRLMDGFPVVAEDGVVMQTGDSALRRFSPDGAELATWSPAYLAGTPSLGADGSTFVGGTQTMIFGLDASGEERWRLLEDVSADRLRSATLGPDGTLYAPHRANFTTGEPAEIWAIASGTRPPEGRWSTEQGDARHTGRRRGPLCGAARCMDPPADVCRDTSTLDAWSRLGTCEAGACVYRPIARACPGGCELGACREP